ncbi:carbon-nitrogen hydrolase family protein [Alloalcanivorax sp. C16-2]|uniref:carbon-nitrogen hydrolase family protein n=1 Tax=Alloalcanivorax TaxID=3020832 RepID=UPI001934766F|nr:carbon-nitrogen hydrolase family protein [Alloalcanivorax marinus]MBL7251859.1 carbon-nitrogen hydrolase family protein [Alloalcanivorax marinus]
MSNPITVAAVQMTSGTDIDANLTAAADGLERAAEGGATLAVLPENFAGYGVDYRQLAERHEALCQWLGERSRALGLWVLGGSLPALTRPDGSAVPAPRVRTRAVLTGPDGAVAARYDKLHLFDADVADAQGRYRESDVFEAGDQVVVAEAGGLRLGLAICYDLRFPLHARALADAGADLIVYPSAFTATTGAAHWRVLLRAAAIQNGCYVLGANQCGAHSTQRTSYGHSLLVDPWGRVVAEGGDGPGVVLGPVDPAVLKTVRSGLPVHTHQRFQVSGPDDF